MAVRHVLSAKGEKEADATNFLLFFFFLLFLFSFRLESGDCDAMRDIFNWVACLIRSPPLIPANA